MWSRVSRLLRHPHLQAPLRVAAGATWLAVGVLSLAAGEVPPRFGAPGISMLAAAFAGAAFVTRLAFRFTKSRWQLAGFALAAGVPQFMQLWDPGARANAEAWFLAVAGALTGIVIGRAVDHLSWRLKRDA